MTIWLIVAIALFLAITVLPLVRRIKPTPVKLTEPKQQEDRLQVQPLSSASRERYVAAWDSLQRQFDVEPEATIRQADRLMQDVMREWGYPTGDFGRASQSVTEQDVEILDTYRRAHRISVKAETDMIPDADAARAMSALRALYERLVAPPPAATNSHKD
jgi:hypothetical protein